MHLTPGRTWYVWSNTTTSFLTLVPAPGVRMWWVFLLGSGRVAVRESVPTALLPEAFKRLGFTPCGRWVDAPDRGVQERHPWETESAVRWI